MMKRVIVGISGASGSIYGIRLLEALRELGVESHLILSDWGKKTLEFETDYTVKQVEDLADFVYDNEDLAASVSSGSFRNEGMIIAPCSMRTLSSISNSFNDHLITRAADVALKERRRLVLVARETPLNLIHIENMKKATAAGAIILPPVPAFYNKPKTLDDIINHSVSRALDLVGIENSLTKRWSE